MRVVNLETLSLSASGGVGALPDDDCAATRWNLLPVCKLQRGANKSLVDTLVRTECYFEIYAQSTDIEGIGREGVILV